MKSYRGDATVGRAVVGPVEMRGRGYLRKCRKTVLRELGLWKNGTNKRNVYDDFQS